MSGIYIKFSSGIYDEFIYMYEQAVMLLCQGIENKELWVQVSNLQSRSIEEAVDKLRLFQHNTQAIYGKPNTREVRQVMGGRYEVFNSNGAAPEARASPENRVWPVDRCAV